VPYSAMARWAKRAEKAIMIDGCFLKCHGRALKKLSRFLGSIACGFFHHAKRGALRPKSRPVQKILEG
jgi:hypothetical protein